MAPKKEKKTSTKRKSYFNFTNKKLLTNGYLVFKLIMFIVLIVLSWIYLDKLNKIKTPSRFDPVIGRYIVIKSGEDPESSEDYLKTFLNFDDKTELTADSKFESVFTITPTNLNYIFLAFYIILILDSSICLITENMKDKSLTYLNNWIMWFDGLVSIIVIMTLSFIFIGARDYMTITGIIILSYVLFSSSSYMDTVNKNESKSENKINAFKSNYIPLLINMFAALGLVIISILTYMDRKKDEETFDPYDVFRTYLFYMILAGVVIVSAGCIVKFFGYQGPIVMGIDVLVGIILNIGIPLTIIFGWKASFPRDSKKSFSFETERADAVKLTELHKYQVYNRKTMETKDIIICNLNITNGTIDKQGDIFHNEIKFTTDTNPVLVIKKAGVVITPTAGGVIRGGKYLSGGTLVSTAIITTRGFTKGAILTGGKYVGGTITYDKDAVAYKGGVIKYGDYEFVKDAITPPTDNITNINAISETVFDLKTAKTIRGITTGLTFIGATMTGARYYSDPSDPALKGELIDDFALTEATSGVFMIGGVISKGTSVASANDVLNTPAVLAKTPKKTSTTFTTAINNTGAGTTAEVGANINVLPNYGIEGISFVGGQVTIMS